ncbi:MAG: hypothetical protein R3337_00110 [Gammaproteobacteria bacterium]|nr:hypothetical protein [Gammaproteobacteria bacterium]
MPVGYTATVAGADYGFDFEDQRIDVDAALSVLEVPNLWTAIKFAMESVPGVAYPPIAEGEGLTVLDGPVSTYLTVRLLDSWEVNTLLTSGKFTVRGGNLVRADEEDPFRDNPLITYINNISQAGTVTAVGSGVTAGDITAISAAVWAAAIEGSLTAQQVQRVLLAVAAGDATAPTGEGSFAFRDQANSKDRVAGSIGSGGARTVSTVDGS